MVISLGCNCNNAIYLRELGLRTVSLPFDWLWNELYGMKYIHDIINSDFDGMKLKTDYSYSDSYYKYFNQRVTDTNKYPGLIHLHISPFRNIEKLNRRFIRFSNLINQDNIYLYSPSFRDEEISLIDQIKYYEDLSKLLTGRCIMLLDDKFSNLSSDKIELKFLNKRRYRQSHKTYTNQLIKIIKND